VSDDLIGKHAGFVRDANDPDNRGRLRLYVPEVMGETDDTDHWTDWALPCFPWFAHLGTGGVLVPQPDDGWGVWVEFRQGDPRFPIWCGVFPIGSSSADATKIVLEAGGLARIDADKVMVGGDINVTFQAPGPNSLQVVTGRTVDPFTGAPLSTLGGSSTMVFVKL